MMNCISLGNKEYFIVIIVIVIVIVIENMTNLQSSLYLLMP